MHRHFLLVLLVFASFAAESQIYIRSTEDSAVVMNAQVKQGEKGTPYFSDTKGKVKMPELKNGFVYITVTHPGYDTTSILAGNNQTIYLKPKITLFSTMVYTGTISEKKSNKDLVNNVRIIGAEDIRSTGSQNLGDILKYQPNITLSNDAVLGTSVSINGMSGQNVKLLKNGAGVSGAMNGSIDVSQISLNNVEQVEIIEGPMSLLYGSNALAGTINLINKIPSKKTQVSAKGHTESSGVYNISGGISNMIAKTYLGVHVGRNFFDGWNPGNRFMYHPVSHEPTSERNMLWKPRQQVLSDISLFWPVNKYTYVKLNSDYLDETIVNRGLPLQPYFESAFDDYYKTFRNINSAELNINRKLLRHNAFLSYSFYNRTKNTYLNDLTKTGIGILSAPESQDSTRIRTTQARYIGTARLKKWTFNAGMDANNEVFTGKRVLNDRQGIFNVSFIGITSYAKKDKLDVKFGLRQTIHSRNKIPLIPSFSSRIKLTKALDLKLSLAKGYRTPGVKELYLYFVDINHNIKGNENLQSESSVNGNMVLDYSKKISKNATFSSQLNTYYNAFKNLITLAAISLTEYTYVNIGTSKSRGVNMELKYENRRFMASWRNAVISSSNNDLDNPVPKYFTTINHFIQARYLFLKQKNLSLNTYVNHFGKSPALAYADNKAYVVRSPEYWMIDFTCNYRLTFRKHTVNLAGGMKNLANITTLNSGFNNTSAHQVSTGQRIISTGRTLFLSLEYSL